MAVHALDEVHETASRAMAVPPAGLGTGRTAHLVPFHDSASAEVPAPLADDPTAMHRSAPGQASAASDPFATTASGALDGPDRSRPGCPRRRAGTGHLPGQCGGSPKENRRAPAETGTAEGFQAPVPRQPAGRVIAAMAFSQCRDYRPAAASPGPTTR